MRRDRPAEARPVRDCSHGEVMTDSNDEQHPQVEAGEHDEVGAGGTRAAFVGSAAQEEQPQDCPTVMGPDEGPGAAEIVRAAVRGYLSCALWLTTTDDGDSIDHLTLSRVDPHFEAHAREDLADFVMSNLEAVQDYLHARLPDASACAAAELLGHDFWLTRNRHGAGSRDRGLGDLGELLAEACEGYGEVSTFLHDDGGSVLSDSPVPMRRRSLG